MKIYGCTQDNNECPKKDECRRYVELQEVTATLFKEMCNEDSNYSLYMKCEQEGDQS